ncbi:MAG: hypothetical protein ACO1QB_06120 [Verrucomicrobiales bacterium]
MNALFQSQFRIALALFLSGVASLGFQMVWTRQSSAGIGHELSATIAMVAAFMGGLSLGAFLAVRLLQGRREAKNFYAAAEALIGLWGLISIWLMPMTAHWARQWIGLESSGMGYWIKAFASALVATLPATAAMGATMVIAHKLISTHTNGPKIGFIYAMNTFGAMTGAWASTYLLLGWAGFSKALVILSSLNFIAAVVAWFLPKAAKAKIPASHISNETQADSNVTNRPADSSKTWPTPTIKSEKRPTAAARHNKENGSAGRVGVLSPQATLFATGFLGMSYEMLGVRVLSHSLENTIYTFASTLAVYLFGTAVGAAFYEKRFGKTRDEKQIRWFFIMSLSILAGGLAMWWSPQLYAWLRSLFGDNSFGVFLAETSAAAAVFLLPTFCMGALFSNIAKKGLREGCSSGSLFGINTLGSALGPIVLSLVLYPWIGSRWCLVFISIGYLLLTPAWKPSIWVALAIAVSIGISFPSKLTRIDLPPGGTILAEKDGAMAGVAVIQTAEGHRVLKVNNRFQMGGTAAAVAEQRHADIPLLLHGEAASALFLGLGTGITFATATNYPGLKADGVELNPQVVQVMPSFFKAPALPPDAFPSLRVFIGDARRFASQLPDKYDVIVPDLFHPAQDGAGFLYTVEHYKTLKNRLKQGGLVCQWLPLYQMNEETFRVITASFLQVFPRAEAWMLRFNIDTPVVGLISRPANSLLKPNWVENQIAAPNNDILQEHLRRVSLGDTVRLAGSLVANNRELTGYVSGAKLNTDNFPRVIFEAPSHAYKKSEKNHTLLFSLLNRFDADLQGVLSPESLEGNLGKRTKAFINARDIYLNGLALEAEGKVLPAVDAYIESARISEDFTLGYAQAITIAAALAQPNPKAARELLERLAQAQPNRPVAREMLRRLENSR